jgi:hypothetical protein
VHPVRGTGCVRALVRGDASVNGPNGDATPLGYALPSAWNALAECGATIDLSAAASLGMIDRVRQLMTLDGGLQPSARLGPPRPAQEVKDEATVIRAGHSATPSFLQARRTVSRSRALASRSNAARAWTGSCG